MKVSLIVPCRNERAHIRSFLDNIQTFEQPATCAIEMLIADGNSTDGTREILNEHSIRVIDNPEGIASTALNRAIALSTGDVIIRLDVHARYASDYVVQCLNVLQESGADNVGGAARAMAHGYMQEAIAAAYNSPYACGGARFHDVDYEGWVDTVTFGCWPRELFDRLGLFDETLVRNQDDEHNLRITLNGGKIFQSPRIQCWYEPRSTLTALFRQYYQFGYWKVRVIRKHGRAAALRHLVPATFVGTEILLAAFSLFNVWAARLLMATTGLYLGFLIAASLRICIPRRKKLLPVVPAVLAAYQLSYGLGFLVALVRNR
ncbi:MAG TPA: glycosyltransferase family 2 protein [Bryobacteraceae bacterium]|jgi:glycosyltransferase involved in cell wall biosynthesis|nr:glycosyltransferase family 2 protein [Bryobacteraceae bacterium]